MDSVERFIQQQAGKIVIIIVEQFNGEWIMIIDSVYCRERIPGANWMKLLFIINICDLPN